MGLRNTSLAYGSITKWFHWLIFFLVSGMIIYGFFLDDLPQKYKATGFMIHKLTGLSILVLMILRILWALINPKPLLPVEMPLWQRLVERLVHFLLYAVIIAMPLAGWIGSVAGGRPPSLGSLAITLPIMKNSAISKAAFSVHNKLAIVIIVLVSVHALAALYHHFLKRDDVLKRMLPSTSEQ